MPRTKDKASEKDMLDLLGSIAAGECERVLVLAEKVTPSGEKTLIVRFGGMDDAEARKLVVSAFWPTLAREKEKNNDV